MFFNDYRNRLQNTAIPVLCLDPPPPPPPRAPRPPNQLKMVGTHLMLVNELEIVNGNVQLLTSNDLFRKTVFSHHRLSE